MRLIDADALIPMMKYATTDSEIGVEETMRFKKPKNGHYTCYCYGCKHYAFERQVGCAYIGTCSAIEGEPTEADAYDPPCGLWEKKGKKGKKDE